MAIGIGRNERCSCGSGLKFKKCCLNNPAVYQFKVTLWEEPGFSAYIQAKETDTLFDLHCLIQKAFDWDDDHLFSFYMNNKIWDERFEYDANPLGEGSASEITIGALDLNPGKKFAYLFDYGDEHVFEVETIKVEKSKDGSHKSMVLSTEGTPPEQYAPIDEDYEEEGLRV